jgi:hypothetical protein
MFNNAVLTKTPECAVCCATHDEDTHEATLRLHQWFRHQVTRYLVEEELDAAVGGHPPVCALSFHPLDI